jgi:magnesium-transporting ATPase (P-type)
MRIQNLSEEDVPAAMQSSPGGISEAEARRRLLEYGKNILQKPHRKRLIYRFIAEFTHLFAVILWLAALLCFVSSATSSQQGMNAIGVAIVAVIFINAIFSFWQTLRAERALEELEKLLPKTTRVLRDKIWSSCSADEIVPGDMIELREGEIAGADIRILESVRLRVDTSYLTGESVPAFRQSTADPADSLLHARNILLAGMRIVAGSAKGVVFATGSKTEFGKIAKLTLTDKPKQSPLQQEIGTTGKRIALIAVTFGIVLFAAGLAAGLETSQALVFGIGLIVANIPEGLMPTMTLSLAIAAQRMAKKKSLSDTCLLLNHWARQR